MSAVDSVLGMFEGDAKRMLWLPVITLGYLFTLNGSPIEFWFGVTSIGGARLFGDLFDSDVADADASQRMKILFEHYRQCHWISVWTLAAVMIVYGASVVISIFDLYSAFQPKNIVLVGLSGVWLGIGVISTLRIVVAFGEP